MHKKKCLRILLRASVPAYLYSARPWEWAVALGEDGALPVLALALGGGFPPWPPCRVRWLSLRIPQAPLYVGGEPMAPPSRGTPAQYFCHRARGTALPYELVSWGFSSPFDGSIIAKNLSKNLPSVIFFLGRCLSFQAPSAVDSIVQHQHQIGAVRLPVHVTVLIPSILTRGRFGLEDRANHHSVVTPFPLE